MKKAQNKIIPSKECTQCGKSFFKKPTHSTKVWEKVARFCSGPCHDKWRSINSRMEKSGNWKGLPDYDAIHHWMYFNYGKANRCDNRIAQFLSFRCNGETEKFQWARLHGKKLERNRASFAMLCASCHSKYDRNPDSTERRRNTMKKKYPDGYKPTEETRRLIGLASKGNKYRLGKTPWNKGLKRT